MVTIMKTMPSWTARALITATAAGSLAGTALTAGPAVAATHVTALPCSASMSNSHPRDYTTIKVNVHTAAFAGVTTVAHYKTTNTTHHGTAGHRGNVSISYYISGATPGYKVKVSVSVKSGTRRGSCSTSFTPHA
jgi:hypothetical protein